MAKVKVGKKLATWMRKNRPATVKLSSMNPKQGRKVGPAKYGKPTPVSKNGISGRPGYAASKSGK